MAITINGSGSISGITAGGLPDGTVTADDLASTLDLSGKTVTLPDSGLRSKLLFAASSGSVTNMATLSTFYKMSITSELYDPDSVYDAANSKFIAPETGDYLITLASDARLNTTGDIYQVRFYKNGTAVTGDFEQGVDSSNAQTNIYCSKFLSLSASDYIEVYCGWTGTGSGRAANFENGPLFMGYKIS